MLTFRRICTFGERKNGKLIEKGTMCKMARRQMVRWLAEHGITKPEELKKSWERCFHSQSLFIKEIFIIVS